MNTILGVIILSLVSGGICQMCYQCVYVNPKPSKLAKTSIDDTKRQYKVESLKDDTKDCSSGSVRGIKTVRCDKGCAKVHYTITTKRKGPAKQKTEVNMFIRACSSNTKLIGCTGNINLDSVGNWTVSKVGQECRCTGDKCNTGNIGNTGNTHPIIPSASMLSVALVYVILRVQV